jgi:hypothetical protein
VVDEYEVLRERCDELAARFTDLFRRHLWPSLSAPKDGADGPAAVPAPDRLDDVRRALDELGGLALEVVDTTLRHAIQDAAEAFLDEQADALAAGPAPAERKAPRPKAAGGGRSRPRRPSGA